MPKIKLSDYIAERLKKYWGIEHFFMVSGGGAMHLNDSLGRVIPYTACHNEQACAYAAEGYARVNQKTALVNVTTGPGGLNCLSGLFGQWTDSVPVLYISGQVKFTTTMSSCPEIPLRQLGDQEADIISAVKHMTKYAVMVTEPKEIKYHLDRAVYETQNGRKGPVWLDIPINVQSALIDEDELTEFTAFAGAELLTNHCCSANKHPSPLAGEGAAAGEAQPHSLPGGEGYIISHRFYAPYIKEFSRELRKNRTNEENLLWNILRNNNTGYKFRRQFSIDNKYIADFVCLEKRIIIEVDGGQHNGSFEDIERTFYLEKENFRIIRFWNNEIRNNIEGCYEVILNELNAPLTLTLSRKGRGRAAACEILNKLLSFKRPLIIAGHGIRLSGQIETFNKLIEKLQLPAAATFNGFDIIKTDNPYYIGRIGTIGQRAGNFALQNADCILCLGTRNNIRQVSYNWENFAKNAYKIIVDIDAAELNKPLVKPDMPVNADLAELLPELISALDTPSPLAGAELRTDEVRFAKAEMTAAAGEGMTGLSESNYKTEGWGEGCKTWLSFCRKLKEKYSFENHPERIQKSNVIEPYHFTYTLTKCLKENDIIVTANGSACVCTFQNAIVKQGQRYILNSGCAAMGFGLSAAIGAWYQAACLNHPVRFADTPPKEGNVNVICIEGDGSIMMNLQELQTVIHNQIPLKLFVINNCGYSSIRQTQRNFFEGRMTGSGIDSGVSVPDFTKIAAAFGLKTKRIDNPDTMERDIKEVLNTQGAVLAEVITEKEYSFLPKLSSKQLPDGSMVSASLEDMFPFLSREEYESCIIKE